MFLSCFISVVFCISLGALSVGSFGLGGEWRWRGFWGQSRVRPTASKLAAWVRILAGQFALSSYAMTPWRLKRLTYKGLNRDRGWNSLM